MTPEQQIGYLMGNSLVMTVTCMILAGLAWWILMRLVGRSQDWPWADVQQEIVAGNVAVAIYKGLLAIALAIVMGMAVGCTPASAAGFNDKYDGAFKEAWSLYHPGDDWRWWKAQCFQESRLDPNARSPVGALGLAQFMPATAMQYGLVDRRLAEPSIHAGAKMMRDLMRFWKAPRTPESRRRLAQASYNAGAGNLVKAQRRCGGPNEYAPIIACLPRVTGDRNARETAGYAPRIERWYEAMR